MAELDSSILRVDPSVGMKAAQDVQTFASNQQTLEENALKLQVQRQDIADQHAINQISRTLDPSSPTYFSDLLDKSAKAGVSAKTIFDLKSNVNQAESQDLAKQKVKLDITDTINKMNDSQFARFKTAQADIGEDLGKLNQQWKNATPEQQKDPVFQGQMKTVRDNDIKDHLNNVADMTIRDMKQRGTNFPGDINNMTADQKTAVLAQAAKAGDPEAQRYLSEVQKWQGVTSSPWNSQQMDSLTEFTKTADDAIKMREDKARLTEAETKAKFAERTAVADIREKEAQAKKVEAEAGAANDPQTVALNANLIMKDPTGLSRMSATDRRAAMQYLAHQGITADDIVNGRAQGKAWQQTVAAFDKGKQGDTTRSLNVAVSHLGVLEDAAKGLNNKDTRTVNKFYNLLSKEFGKSEVTNFDFAKQVVGDEVVKAVMGSGAGGVTDREHLQAQFDAANSPKQLGDVIKEAKRLMGGQLVGLRQQYVSAGVNAGQDEKKVTEQFNRKLSKGTVSQLEDDTTTDSTSSDDSNKPSWAK